MKWLEWDDLTEAEKFQATESYVFIREMEEDRERNEINNDYPEPIDPNGVKCCRFERMSDGYIFVNI